MTRKEIHINCSSVILFIDMQEIGEDIQHHAFELVSVNIKGWYNSQAEVSKTKLMVGKYMMSRDYHLGMGHEKDRSGIITLLSKVS